MGKRKKYIIRPGSSGSRTVRTQTDGIYGGNQARRRSSSESILPGTRSEGSSSRGITGSSWRTLLARRWVTRLSILEELGRSWGTRPSANIRPPKELYAVHQYWRAERCSGDCR